MLTIAGALPLWLSGVHTTAETHMPGKLSYAIFSIEYPSRWILPFCMKFNLCRARISSTPIERRMRFCTSGRYFFHSARVENRGNGGMEAFTKAYIWDRLVSSGKIGSVTQLEGNWLRAGVSHK